MPVQCICSTCGKFFARTPSQVKPKNYCSLPCRDAASRNRSTGTPSAPIVSDDGLTAQVPLYGDNDTVLAFAIIDSTDATDIGRHRWGLASDGYVRRLQNDNGYRHTVLMHRQVLGLVYGDGIKVDHKDRDRLNCCRSNLRIATYASNAQNKSSYRGSSSRYRGVSWHKGSGKWAAYAQVGGKTHWLGRFSDETEAARVAQEARARLMPFAMD